MFQVHTKTFQNYILSYPGTVLEQEELGLPVSQASVIFPSVTSKMMECCLDFLSKATLINPKLTYTVTAIPFFLMHMSFILEREDTILNAPLMYSEILQ